MLASKFSIRMSQQPPCCLGSLHPAASTPLVVWDPPNNDENKQRAARGLGAGGPLGSSGPSGPGAEPEGQPCDPPDGRGAGAGPAGPRLAGPRVPSSSLGPVAAGGVATTECSRKHAPAATPTGPESENEELEQAWREELLARTLLGVLQMPGAAEDLGLPEPPTSLQPVSRADYVSSFRPM